MRPMTTRGLALLVLVAQIAALGAAQAAALCACPMPPANASDCCTQPAFRAGDSCCAPSATRAATPVAATPAPASDMALPAVVATDHVRAEVTFAPPALRLAIVLPPAAPPLVLRI
jgi:hypothetical protein